MKRAVVIAAMVSCASACSIALGLDKNEYTRGSSAVSADAAAESGDDAAGDGAAGDGAAGGDGAPTDGGRTDAVVPVSPCTASHLVCDDFDKPGTLTSHGWDNPFVENGSTVDYDTVDVVSAPQSLKILGNPNGSASIGWPPMIDVTATKDLTLAYDLRVVDPGPGVAMTALYIRPYSVRIIVYASGTISVDEWDDTTGRVSNTRASSTNVKGRWAHVELTLHFVANKQAGSRVVLAIDGATIIDDAASPTVNGGPVGFDIGDIDHPNGNVALRFDNVTFDAK